MKSFILSVSLAALATVLTSGCGAGTNSPDTAVGTTAAQSWLNVIDQNDYLESWNETDPIFQKAVTTNQWNDAMERFREPLGAVISRKLISASVKRRLPGAPNGEYVVMQFATSFANQKNTIETVTVGPKQNGRWKVSGYYIK